MRLFLGVWILLAAFCCSARERTPATNDLSDLSIAELRASIARHVAAARFAEAAWGVKIVSLSSGAVLFETNAQKLLKPASNAKLYTGALALDTLGPDFQIETSLYAARNDLARDGTLKGSLIVYGRGDPSFSARFHNGSYSNLLGPVVHAVQQAGIKRIEGGLVGDDTFFNGPHLGAGWAWDDLEYYYGAEVSALTFQDNVIDLTIHAGHREGEPCRIDTDPVTSYMSFVNRTRTLAPKSRSAGITIERPLGENRAWVFGGLAESARPAIDSVSVHNPALWFVTMLKEALEKSGIEVRGPLTTRSWPEEGPLDKSSLREVASIKSPPLSEIIEKMMKPSENLYAQLLLLQVGVASGQKTADEVTTEDLGMRALRRFVQRAGIKPNEVQLEEGSGLSRSALVTPNATVQLLSFMARHKNAALFRSFLPIAGVDGSLRKRLVDLKGNVHAKTGSLRFVNTLSGYMTNRAGEDLAFSLMLNAYESGTSRSGRDELDEIPRLLARVAEKGGGR
jgi:D-alanyl-D-alanine carboxypeptidase/D-alanyl-D-alanine-endopeptidase (penicillin-binding protein 4)